MIAIMSMDEHRPHGSCMGKQVSGQRLTEAKHHFRCPLSGGYVDMRDRVWLEKYQGPLPHPACDRAQ
jgi:hypothetical protein